MTKEQILKIYQEKFGNDTPEVYASPGRVNTLVNIPIITEVLFSPELSTKG